MKERSDEEVKSNNQSCKRDPGGRESPEERTLQNGSGRRRAGSDYLFKKMCRKFKVQCLIMLSKKCDLKAWLRRACCSRDVSHPRDRL